MMLNEERELIKEIFTNYFANGLYFAIFLVALIIFMVEEKRKENKRILLYYPILVLIITLNPLFCKIILKFIGKNVYYRFMWLLPFGIVIAYLGTFIIAKASKKVKKTIICTVFIGMLLYCGNFIYTNETFEKVNNWYKLPDESIQVTQMIEKIPLDNKKAMVSTDLVGYIRQLDASIKLAYQRRPYADYQMYPIVKYYNAGDVKNLVKLCKQNDVNLIIYDKSISLLASLTEEGYDLYGQTEHYDIYAQTQNQPSNLTIDEETIPIEGLQNDYQLCFINDLHIIAPDDEVSTENQETVRQRYEEVFKTSTGEHSSELWNKMPAKINELNPDYVILGADMVDYVSKANIEALKNGMEQINQEIMYLRADHDYGRNYNPQLTQDDINQLEKSIDENSEIFCKDLGEILIVGINNSTSQISENALKKLKEIFAKEKPIILATHVPFNSKVDNTLAEKSKKVWQDRNLTWDQSGTFYTADKNTKEFLNLLYAENSPVKAVLAGHLHFKHTGKINENITQYVFDASYQGKIGILHIVGK